MRSGKGRSKSGQVSMDFLSGMTILALTFIFAVTFSFQSIGPYVTGSPESSTVAQRVSDSLIGEITEGSRTTLDNDAVSDFFSQDTSKIRESLGIPGDRGFNITVVEESSRDILHTAGDDVPDTASVSVRRRAVYTPGEGNSLIEVKIW